MDTSKSYIKKCEKADEIRTHWQPKNGDYFQGTPEDLADLDLDKGIYQYFVCEDEYYNIIPQNYDVDAKEFTDDTDAIRLPSQRDLQDMLLYETPLDLIKDFSEWVANLSITFQERYQTMEQLWLGFVMEKNYNKSWSGKDWVVK